MFDQKPNSPSASSGEPQDIFAGVEPPDNLPIAKPTPKPGAPIPKPNAAVPAPISNSPAPGAARPTPSAPSSLPKPANIINPKTGEHEQVGMGHMPKRRHGLRTALIILFALVAIGVTAFVIYQVMQPKDSGQPVNTSTNTNTPSQTNSQTTTDEPESLPQAPVVLDTDGDGLTNDEEREAGTNIAKPDTDNDSLGDKEEVQVYGTDPLNPDTDGDGFKDGEEVKAGYNPKGPGKLLEIPSATTTTEIQE
jgi:hypothetical protein